MNRYFMIRKNDGLITDVIVWDGVSKWSPPENYYVLPQSDNTEARIGWRKIESGWESPPTKNHSWNGTEWIDRSNNGDN